MSFKHNSTNISAEEYELLPEGWYPLRIYEAEELKSKKGYDMVLAKCEVFNDPRYPSTSLWHYVVFLPEGEKGAGISVHFRKACGLPFGGDDVIDAEEWKGKKFMGSITVEEYEGKKRNKIAKVSPMPDAEVAQKSEEDIPF